MMSLSSRRIAFTSFAGRNFGGLVGVRQQKENGSEWRMILSGGQCSRTAEKFGASGDAPSSLSACFSRLRFRSH
jgi:hypothetical protein